MKNKLEIQISTYGDQGLKEIADKRHPEVDGVCYLVSAQGITQDYDFGRDDFRLITEPHGRGLSYNRNFALDHASAPWVLIADDDLTYTKETLEKLLVILEENKDADFLCFRFAGNKKKYPQEKTKFPVKLRDYYPSSVEMALNLRKIGGRVRYDTRFGIGHDYCMGEESVLVNDLLAMECQGWFIPFTVTSHYGPSSGSHETMTPERLVAKGAVNAHIHPLSFPLRLLSQALRLRENRKLGIMKFLKYTLKGGFRYMRK